MKIDDDEETRGAGGRPAGTESVAAARGRARRSAGRWRPLACRSALAASCMFALPAIAAGGPESASVSAGERIYEAQCAACHRADGEGVPGAFPPHRGHVAKVYAAEGGVGGRTYLSHVVLYGLTGPIEAAGRDYDGNMPGWGGQLSNQQIADVLNYLVTTFGNGTRRSADLRPYTAAEIGAEAGKGLDGGDVHRERQALAGLGTGGGGQAADRSAAAVPAAELRELVPEPIYVAVQNSGNIDVLPGAQSWSGVEGAHYAASNADGSLLLASGFKTGNVYVIDTATGKVRSSIAIGGVAQGVKISPDGRYGLAMAESLGEVAFVDLAKGELVRKLQVGKMPHNASFSADGKLAYVTLQGEGRLAVIDMASLDKIRDIPTPGLDTPHNLDLTEDGRYLWLRDFTGRAGVLDLEQEKMVTTLEVGKGHGGIDVLPGGRYVATGAIADSIVTIIDAASHERVADVEVGSGPHGVRASRDGHWIYASLTGDDAVAVIDTGTLEVARRIPVTGDFPFWIAVPGNP